MTTLFSPIREFFKKGDVLLLFLCLTASGYGLALIYSAPRYLDNNNRNVIVQAIAICIGACTPPMATCLFTSCKTLGLEVSDTFPDIFLVCGYFILMELVLLFIPQITTCVLGIM